MKALSIHNSEPKGAELSVRKPLLILLLLVTFSICCLSTEPQGTWVVSSWYGENHDGLPMANCHSFDPYMLTVAHRTIKLGKWVLLRRGQAQCWAQVTDRGPYIKDKRGEYTRDLDCSWLVAKCLGFIEEGVTKVQIVKIADKPS